MNLIFLKIGKAVVATLGLVLGGGLLVACALLIMELVCGFFAP